MISQYHRADAACLMGVASKEENKEKVLKRVDLNFNSQPQPQAGLLIHDYTTIHLASGAPPSNLLSSSERWGLKGHWVYP